MKRLFAYCLALVFFAAPLAAKAADNLDGYVGTYQLGRYFMITMTRDGDRLFSQASGQPKFELFPREPGKYFAKIADVEVTFKTPDGKTPDAKSPASSIVVHQNNANTTGARIDAATVRRVAQSLAARVDAQKPLRGSEDALRAQIAALVAGQPLYDKMSAGLSAATRRQLLFLQPGLVKLGALQEVTFKKVGPGGADIYQAKFENGTTEWRILLEDDGMVETMMVRGD